VNNVLLTVKAVSGFIVTTVSDVKIQLLFQIMEFVLNNARLGILKMGIALGTMSVLIKDADRVVPLGSVINVCPIIQVSLLVNGNNYYLHFS
jgi:hypothetical protein